MINSFTNTLKGFGWRELVAFVAGLALMLAIAPAILQAASVNTSFSGPLTVEENSTESVSADTSSYENLEYSFDYDAEGLDGGDTLTFGWREAGGSDNQLGTINGSNESGTTTETDEIGSENGTLPVGAQISNLEFYFTNSGTAETDDDVIISNFVLEGDDVVVSACTVTNISDTPQTTYTTIQDAIDAADGGETLVLMDGSVCEGFSVPDGLDGLTIQAETQNGATISETPSGNNRILDLRGDNTTIDGLVIESQTEGAGVGISISGQGNTIQNNEIHDSLTAIQTTTQNATGNNTIIDNETENVDYGISLQNTGNSIERNNIETNVEALGASVGSNTIQNNNFVTDGTDAQAYASASVVATSNWWGDEAGPDTVVGDVTVDPWLCAPYDESPETSENGSCADPVVKTTQTTTIRDNTASGENDAGGWLFNRDQSTQSEYEFNTDESAVGDGALYVFPIDGNINGNADKFIGEYFALEEIANVDSFSYDFQLGSSSDVSDANEFYLNVYANYGESDDTKYYDCKYDVVPTIGSTNGFTTITFDPTQSYPVTTLTGKSWAPDSPYTCPSIPAEMDLQSPDSTIRMFAINVGDTSANDAGVSGYFDKVVFETDTTVTTYDFEAGFEGETSEITIATTENPDGTKTGTVNGDTTVTVRNDGEPNVVVTMEDGTQVTGPADWDGTIVFEGDIALTEVELENGDVYEVITAIELGYEGGTLTFDQPVKILFEDEAGNRVGFMRDGEFVEITETCDSATNPILGAGADCKTDSAGDLVVWTMHFTTFVTLGSEVSTSNSGGTRTSGSGGGSSSSNDDGPTPQVLGASTFGQCGIESNGATLLKDYLAMWLENDSWEVTKLQAFMMGQGHFNVGTIGVFNETLEEVVKAYQTEHYDEILQPWVDAGLAEEDFSATGYVYLFTRWTVNNTVCEGSESKPVLN